MASELKPDVVSDTVTELADPENRSRDAVMRRLRDWKQRVHDLYADIERALSEEFVVDRSGQHRSHEELVQRVELSSDQVPPVDILRIEQPKGTLRAVLQPGALWIIGANGSLELRLFRSASRQSIYRIIDMSRPLMPPAEWVITQFGDPTDKKPFSGTVLRSMLQ